MIYIVRYAQLDEDETLYYSFLQKFRFLRVQNGEICDAKSPK